MIDSITPRLKSPALAGLFFSLCLLITACQSPKPADQITLRFWDAMAKQDQAAIYQYLCAESQSKINELKPPFDMTNSHFSVGQIVINDTLARVETHVLKADQTQSVFTTFLVKVNQNWCIDYQRTQASLNNHLLNGLIDSLNNIGENLNKQLEGQIPLIEKKLQTFNQELKKQLDLLGEELERVLRPPEDQEDPYQDSI